MRQKLTSFPIVQLHLMHLYLHNRQKSALKLSLNLRKIGEITEEKETAREMEKSGADLFVISTVSCVNLTLSRLRGC